MFVLQEFGWTSPGLVSQTDNAYSSESFPTTDQYSTSNAAAV